LEAPWGALHQTEGEIRDISEPFDLRGLLEGKSRKQIRLFRTVSEWGAFYDKQYRRKVAKEDLEEYGYNNWVLP
jgi:hypothetical protein